MLKTCTGSSHLDLQNRDGGSVPWLPTTSQEAVCIPYLLPKGKSVFSKDVSVDMTTTLQERPYGQELGLHKTKPIVFIGT